MHYTGKKNQPCGGSANFNSNPNFLRPLQSFICFNRNETRPFFGWIKDLSPDPTSLFNLFGLIPWDPPMFLTIGIWPLLMGLTMYLQQKINPPPPDPIQAKVFMMLPFILPSYLLLFLREWSFIGLLTIYFL